MAVTLSVKSFIVDINNITSDADIATGLNDSVTYTNIYGFTCIPISETKARLVVIYD